MVEGWMRMDGNCTHDEYRGRVINGDGRKQAGHGNEEKFAHRDGGVV